MFEVPWEEHRSVKIAWGWIHQAITLGLGKTAGLTAYREGGGRIRTQWWYWAWDQIRAAMSFGNRMAEIHPSSIVPEHMFADTLQNYTERYIAIAEYTIYNPETGESFSSYTTVESSQLLARWEWEEKIRRSLRTPISRPFEGEISIGAVELYRNPLRPKIT